MFKNLDTQAEADVVCEDNKNAGSAKNEFNTLTVEDLSPVIIDLTKMTKISQVVCKS